MPLAEAADFAAAANAAVAASTVAEAAVVALPVLQPQVDREHLTRTDPVPRTRDMVEAMLGGCRSDSHRAGHRVLGWYRGRYCCCMGCGASFFI